MNRHSPLTGYDKISLQTNVVNRLLRNQNLIYNSGLVGYNLYMNIPQDAQNVLLQDAISRDRTTARRVALMEILYQERYLTREQLIARVEGLLGEGCFGASAWQDNFYRDMKVVKSAFKAVGYRLTYSRRLQQPGYYLRDQPAVAADLSLVLEGSIAEVDPAQIAIFKDLSFKQRFRQGCSISNLSCQVVANRIQQNNPEINRVDAQRLALQERRLYERQNFEL